MSGYSHVCLHIPLVSSYITPRFTAFRIFSGDALTRIKETLFLDNYPAKFEIESSIERRCHGNFSCISRAVVIFLEYKKVISLKMFNFSNTYSVLETISLLSKTTRPIMRKQVFFYLTCDSRFYTINGYPFFVEKVITIENVQF